MTASDYVLALRRRVGHDLLLLPSATSLVFDDDGRALLVEDRDTGTWVAPGGAVDPDETPADAAARELWEETGLVGRPTRILGVFGGPGFVVRYRNGDAVSYVMTVFECVVDSGEPAADGDEVASLGWFGADELPAGLSPWAQLVLPVVMRDRGRASFTPASWTPPGS